MDERVIVAYDVADDRRRYRVCKALEHYGERIQYSVFELFIDPKALHRLIDRLQGILHNREDRLLVMHLCGACHSSLGRYGDTGQYTPPDTMII